VTHRRVALVTQDVADWGGALTMATFLKDVISASGRYVPEVISLAVSASDDASVRLVAPKTWMRGVRTTQREVGGQSCVHVGARWTEFEFQRYRPRRTLTRLLRGFDIVQVVVGVPPLAFAASRAEAPLCLWTATTAWPDRASRIRDGSPIRRAWALAMFPAVRYYERRALRAAAQVFALSDYTRASVESMVGPDRVTVAPCGVNTERYHPHASPRRDYIISVARFSDARKNVGLLLRAYAKLRARLGSVPDLYLVGDPPTGAARDLIAELGIARSVRLLGKQSGEALADLYRNALFFVLSSDEEGLGIVILEAMASGLPAVSTDCGGPSMMVTEGETGFLVPAGDVNLLSAAMGRLVDDRERCARMGEAARRSVEGRFSSAAAGKVFIDAYDRLEGATR
jgi:glycosyltransferase involved in cell wall biosynthesis